MTNQESNVVTINDLDITNLTSEKINEGLYLHDAVEANNYDLVKLFLDKGADSNIKNDLDRTPLNLAIKNLNYPNLCPHEISSKIIQALIKAL
jgi:ankyrin repeat protein